MLSLAKSRIRWTESKRVHKAQVSVTSKSKNRIDGFPSQMVGAVSFSPFHTPMCDHSVLKFDLLVPCVTVLRVSAMSSQVFAVDVRECATACHLRWLHASSFSRQHPHSPTRLPSKAMICIAAPLQLASAVLGPLRVKLPSTCLLMAPLPINHPSLIQGQAPHHAPLLHQMLTYATLLQSLES